MEPFPNTKMTPQEFELRLQAMIAERNIRDDELRARMTLSNIKKMNELLFRQVQTNAGNDTHVKPGRNASLSVLMHVMM